MTLKEWQLYHISRFLEQYYEKTGINSPSSLAKSLNETAIAKNIDNLDVLERFVLDELHEINVSM